ncbi:MAG: class I SAM-dependent methyltransferase [Actinobacteria bacterium]|nr:class I SAM-dependent methyltransferase [Actinomycetota bacterium]
MAESLAQLADETKGFLPANEAGALHDAALAAGPGVWLEIGTYCGKSTIYLGAAAQEVDAQLVTVDHHHGSEENQPGWEWHDESLVDPESGRLDTLPSLRRTLRVAGLESVVTPVVGDTSVVANWWSTPLVFLFLDGNHTEEIARRDYESFAQHVVVGGTLAVHDVFPDPADGGQPPWHVVQRAVRSGIFEQDSVCGSLRVLRRVTADRII